MSLIDVGSIISGTGFAVSSSDSFFEIEKKIRGSSVFGSPESFRTGSRDG